MKRRQFFGAATAAGAGSLVTAAFPMPALAQSNPKVGWRMSSAFPNSLDTLYGAAKLLSKYVSDATDGNFTIDVFAAGEIVPPAQIAAIRRFYGSPTENLLVQYVDYWRGLLHFDFGASVSNFPVPVSQMIMQSLPWTLLLIGSTTLLAWLIGDLL